ncbi:MAG: helix-turn-helix transcriptional regulator [Actinobacteria bacterium]|nr:helix-turn-helix transcriptional regulator [Actinomycetota bacterium]
MITNERQYRITKASVARFRQALAQAPGTVRSMALPIGSQALGIVTVPGPAAHTDPRLRQAMRDAVETQLGELEEDLREFEALRSGQATAFRCNTLVDLPDALIIRARVAAGLSQGEPARRLSRKEQQIQRYEARRHAGVGLSRLQAVADALGLKLHARLGLTQRRPTRRGRATKRQAS